MKRNKLNKLPFEQFFNDIPAIFKRTMERLSKASAINRCAVRYLYRDYSLSDIMSVDCAETSSFISFDRIKAEKWADKFNAYLGKESPIKRSQIDLSLEIRDWGGLFINDFNDKIKIKSSLRITPRTIYIDDKDINYGLAKLIDYTIKYNNRQYKDFCDILKTFPFERTFSYAREALKNAKIPEEKNIVPKTSSFKTKPKDGELMKALKVKSRYDDILEARLPHLWRIMFFDLKLITTPSSISIFYGTGWSKRNFRLYCQYMLDKQSFEKNNPDLEKDDIPYLIGKPHIRNIFSDNTAYVGIDGGNFNDSEDVSTMFLETNILELSDKEFIEYLKIKRDELLANLNKVEKEAREFCSSNKEFKNHVSLARKLNNAYLEDLKKTPPYDKYFVDGKLSKTNNIQKSSSMSKKGKSKAS